MTNNFTKFSSFRRSISANAEDRASSFSATADAVSILCDIESFSRSETLALSDCTSASNVFANLSDCRKQDMVQIRHTNFKKDQVKRYKYNRSRLWNYVNVCYITWILPQT